MKIKHLIIVSLILAILTIGAVSASQDSDDIAAGEIEDTIVESSIDDVELSTDDVADDVVGADEEEPVGDGPTSDYNYTISLDDAVVGSNVYTTVQLPKDASGEITAQIDDNEAKSSSIYDGCAYFTFCFGSSEGSEPEDYSLSVGQHVMKFTYEGDEKYAGFTCQRTFDYDVIAVHFPDELIKEWYYDEEDGSLVEVSEHISGFIAINFDDENYINGSAEDLVSYACPGEEGFYYIHLDIGSLSYGRHNYTVYFEDGERQITKTGTFVVSYPMTVYTARETSDNQMLIAYGENATLYVDLPYDVTSNITVILNGVEFEAPAEQYAHIPLSGLQLGVNNVTVKYQDDKYPLKTFEGIIIYAGAILEPYGYENVVNYTTDFAITLELPADAAGELVAYKWGYDWEADEDVYERIGSYPLVNGKACYPLSDFPIGYYSLIFRYVNGTYPVDDLETSLTVLPIIKYNRSVAIGDNASLVLQFPEGENGEVTVKWAQIDEEGMYDETTTFFIGDAGTEMNIPLDTSSEGSYFLFIDYSNGDRGFSDQLFRFVVINASKEWNLTVDVPEKALYGDTVYFEPALPKGHQGNYVLYINGERVESGGYSFDSEIAYVSNKLGTVEWKLVFTDDYFDEASANGTFEVTWVRVPDVIEMGGEGPQGVSVSLDYGSGSAILYVDGMLYAEEEIIDGEAFIEIENLSMGTHTYYIECSGRNLNESGTFNVSFAIRTVIDGIEDGDLPLKDLYNLTVTLPEDATGIVQITDEDGTVYNATLEDGSATVPITLKFGNNNMTIRYSGDANYPSKEISRIFCVSYCEVYAIRDDDGKVTSVYVSLPDDREAYLVVNMGGNEVKRVQLVNGYALVQLDEYPLGCYPMEAYCDFADYPDEYYVESFHEYGISVLPNVTMTEEVVEGDDCLITIYLPNATGEMEIYVDGEYNGSEYASEGKVNFTLSGLEKGLHTITFCYLGWEYENLLCYFDEDVWEYIPIEYSVNVNPADEFDIMVVYDSDVLYLDADDVIVSIFCPPNAEGTLSVGSYEIPITEEMLGKWNNFTLAQLGINTIGDNAINIWHGDDFLDGFHIKTLDHFSITVDPAFAGQTTVTVSANDATIDKTFTGTLTLIVMGNLSEPIYQEIEIENGEGSYTFTQLAEGDYTVSLNFEYDDVTYEVNSTFFFAAKNQVDPNFAIAIADTEEESPLIVNVTAVDTFTGDVTVIINGNDVVVSVADGFGSAEANIALPAGEYTATLDFAETSDFTAAHAETTFNVIERTGPVSANLEVIVSDADLGDSVAIVVKIDSRATGFVSVNIVEANSASAIVNPGYESQYYNKTSTVEIINGYANMTVDDLTSNGRYNVVVSYEGNQNVTSDESSTSFRVLADANLTMDLTDFEVGDEKIVNFTMNVKEGTFSFDFLKVELTPSAPIALNVLMNSGKGNLNVTMLGIGKYTLTATFTGNDYFKECEITGSFEVTPHYEDLNMTVNVEDITVGENATVNIKVDERAWGIIIVTVNGATQTITMNSVAGQLPEYNLTFQDLPVGTHDVVVNFTGTPTSAADLGAVVFFKPVVKTAQIKVKPVQVPVVWNVTANDIYEGQNATVEISINESATGAVTIEINGENKTVEITNGKGTFTIPGLVPGDYSYEVGFAGDEYFLSDRKTVSFTVIPKVDAGLDASASDVYVGQDVVVNIEINENATGIVSINGENVNIENGKGTYTFSGLAADAYAYNVTFAGDVKFDAAVKEVTFTVMPKKDAGLAVSASNVIVGHDVVVSIEINENVTGTVTINGETVTITEGKGTQTFTGLAIGEYTYDVAFAGDDMFNATTKQVSFNVTDKMDAGLVVSAYDVYVGQNVTVSIEINENATGAVTINGETVTITNGKGSKTFTKGAGNYTYAIEFAGDDMFNATTKQVSVEVMPKVANNMTVTVADVYIGSDAVAVIAFNESFTCSVKLTTPNANATVEIVDGKGIFSMSGLAAGEYNVTAVFDGTVKYLPAAANATFKVLNYVPKIVAKDYTMYYNHGTYSVTVYGLDGKVAKDETVVFKVNGAKIGTAKTDAKGVAKIAIKKLPKTYKITSEALGKTVTKKLVVKQVLKLKKVTVKRSAKKIVLQATLKEGKKALKGKKITFRFNGKKIATKKTNKKGVAKVTVKKSKFKKLKVGKKVTYKATYVKNTVKKTVKVKK